jgi:NAD(P)-dependent dehydrogenase (short-subunit alcohol dehydrogenase family)
MASSTIPIPFRLDGDVAIVTGAGSRLQGEIGNGRAISILLARQGAKVALFDVKKEWAEETKAIILGEGGVGEVFECDVTKEESCKAAVEKVVELWGGVRVLVNNGTLFTPSPTHEPRTC